MIANTPPAPYYAVIFSSIKASLSPNEQQAYNQMSEQMEALAAIQPGYLGIETASKNIGITISYWKTLADIANWKQNSDHIMAQISGREKWYLSYATRICLVEKAYSFDKF